MVTTVNARPFQFLVAKGQVPRLPLYLIISSAKIEDMNNIYEYQEIASMITEIET